RSSDYRQRLGLKDFWLNVNLERLVWDPLEQLQSLWCMMSQQQNQNLPTVSQSLLQQTGSEADLKPFSIREYVLASRYISILGNWPFHEKHLQLCLKHGIKEVFPPLKGCSNFTHLQNDNNKEADSCKAEVPYLKDEQPQNIKSECDYKVTNHPSSHEEGNQHKCCNISANLSQPADTCTLRRSLTHVHKAAKDKRRKRKGRCKKHSMVDILAVARHSTLEEIHRMNKFYYAETVIEGCHQTVPCENISKCEDSCRKGGNEDDGVANVDMAAKGPLLLKFKLNGCNGTSHGDFMEFFSYARTGIAGYLRDSLGSTCKVEIFVVNDVTAAKPTCAFAISATTNGEYVVACRQRSILGNWPFHEKHLQLCLKHGIKEVLPPMRCQKQLKGCSNMMHSQNDNTKEADSCKAEVPHVIDEHSQNIKNECDYKVTNHLSSHEEGNQHNCGTISANLSQPADTCTLPTSTHVHKTVKDKRRRRKGRCKKRSMVDILAVARHSTLEEIHRMNKFYYAETVIEGCHQTVP
ncbi:hypothetical protein CR513_29098, partial [Mucuna pruriens]